MISFLLDIAVTGAARKFESIIERVALDGPLNGQLKSGADTRNLYCASMGAPRFSPYLFAAFFFSPLEPHFR